MCWQSIPHWESFLMMLGLPNERFLAKQDWKTWLWQFPPKHISYQMDERQELGSIQDKNKLPKSTTWLWQLREKLCGRKGHNWWVHAFRNGVETSECTVWKPNPLQTLKHPISCAKAYLKWCTWEIPWLVFCIAKLEVMEVGQLPVQHWLFICEIGMCERISAQLHVVQKLPHWVHLWLVNSSNCASF